MASDKICTCQICGKDFSVSAYANPKYCPECRLEAKRRKNRAYNASENGKAKRAASHAQYIADGRDAAAHRRWRESHMEHVREYERARYLAKREEVLERRRLQYAAKVGKPGARLAWAKATGKLTYCERMRVTMYPLPCGTRGECKGCKHCPEGAACGNDGHYRWDMESMNGGRSFR